MAGTTQGGFVSTPGAGEIFQLLRDNHPRTKSELSAITGLSRSTVSGRVDALLAAKLLRPAGEAASTGGRPPARVEFNPDGGCVLALDLGVTHATVAVADLSGRILSSQTRSIAIAEGPETVLQAALDDGRKLLENHPHPLGEPIGVGIGVPGPVEHSTGMLTNPPIMPGWNRFDIPGFIQREFDVPVWVDNDVNILALGEQAIVWPNIGDLIYVKVASGIGAGIIAGGRLQRGAQGSAGDLGHVRVPYTSEFERDPSDDQDLEALASGSAIAARLRADGLSVRDSSDVAQLVRTGDRLAIEATRQAGYIVGEVLSGVVNLLNPSVIVLGGSIARGGEHLLAGVREVVYRRSIPLATQRLAIVQSEAGEAAAAMGAAIMVLQDALSPECISARLAG